MVSKETDFMLIVKHPNKEYNEEQLSLLESMPVSKINDHALIFSYGNACYRYFNEKSQIYEGSRDDFNDWLETLSEALKNDVANKGYEYGRHLIAYRRYLTDKYDVGVDEFVKDLLGEQNYLKAKMLL